MNFNAELVLISGLSFKFQTGATVDWVFKHHDADVLTEFCTNILKLKCNNFLVVVPVVKNYAEECGVRFNYTFTGSRIMSVLCKTTLWALNKQLLSLGREQYMKNKGIQYD